MKAEARADVEGKRDLYFAYGSNLYTRRLQARLPEARAVCVARLNGFQLTFQQRSERDGSGKCDALRTGQNGDLLLGVVYEIAHISWPALDAIEGDGYARQQVLVIPENEPALPVQLYVASRTEPGLLPMSWYKRHVLAGMQEHGFPQPYVAAVAAIADQTDPDSSRHQREMRIHSRTAAAWQQPAVFESMADD